MTQTARLGLVLIESGQIDKATTHNEALASLDLCVSAAIDGFQINNPPTSPTAGSAFVVGSNPTGAWAGQADALAGYTAGGWRFVAAVDGLSAIDKASGQIAVFRDGAWEMGHSRAAKLSINGSQVVGAQLAAVPDPNGGATVDVEARTAIAAILERLRQHGLIAS